MTNETLAAATNQRIDITFVIPCLNEEDNAEAIATAVISEINSLHLEYEIIFIDNGSTDKTVQIIKELCRKNLRIRLIVNNKNYGQLRSPTHAIYQGSGRAIIGICADFQDPPSLIPEFIRRWNEGAKIVLAIRETEKSSLILTSLKALGYGFFSQFGDYKVIPGATGFGLYDRKVIDVVSKWNEPDPFFRGMLVESGFPISTIPYKRPQRARGASKNNIPALVDFAITGLGASSRKLLRFPFYMALILVLLGGLILIIGLVTQLMGMNSILAILTAAFIEILAILFFSLGLIGEQVRIIAQTVRGLPLVVEQERVNFHHRPDI